MPNRTRRAPVVRYVAAWFVRQFVDANGEGDPYKDEYGSSFHTTRKEAQDAAIRNGQAVGECEWWEVEEQHFVRGVWVTMERWTGDWSGFCERTYVNTVDEEEVTRG